MLGVNGVIAGEGQLAKAADGGDRHFQPGAGHAENGCPAGYERTARGHHEYERSSGEPDSFHLER